MARKKKKHRPDETVPKQLLLFLLDVLKDITAAILAALILDRIGL